MSRRSLLARGEGALQAKYRDAGLEMPGQFENFAGVAVDQPEGGRSVRQDGAYTSPGRSVASSSCCVESEAAAIGKRSVAGIRMGLCRGSQAPSLRFRASHQAVRLPASMTSPRVPLRPKN